MAQNFKLETGIQLLSRLNKKAGIKHFYPILFQTGPQQGEIVEIYSNSTANPLLNELITALLLPQSMGGIESGVLYFNTDGNFNKHVLIKELKNKINIRIVRGNIEMNNENVQSLLCDAIKNLYIVDIYNASQFYVTIQNLDNILMKHPNISVIVFNSLTAFYWSEQSFMATKMDLYLKKLLRTIQKVVKDFKTVIIYTRPEHFSSSKETIENLDPCCPVPTEERINYRLQILYSNNNNTNNFIVVQTYKGLNKIPFKLKDNEIVW